MNYVDLHVHSNASDGTLSPSGVVALAAEKGLKSIALTDHDTIDGIEEALSASSSHHIEVIPGVELSALYHEKEIHILGLFVDIHHPVIEKALGHMREIRHRRNEEILRRFSEAGMEITMAELQNGNPGTVITRAHFARVLFQKGYVSSMNQAFKKYLKPGSKYCPVKERIAPELAMELLTACHAVPALAHPLQYKFGNDELDGLIAYLTGLGMQALEVYHSSNSAYESMRLKELAVKYGLLPTGGSDFHGANKPDIDIGFGRGGLRISSLLLEDIRQLYQSNSGR
ncbi:PHP domain-containing protein [Clostridium sp. AM58-1XD]|uniref:PHP domain-containing protein n=1 Tax=Clostridium sp. AM58-1XD TaxID=2292307 RepID=UPI000E497CE9|nr:PHP domain-containing protein [Clostridium sp. AM58-1XD]RGY96733.1 PHP domain-containing protein [Clostridium sp. AM58-1XD]